MGILDITDQFCNPINNENNMNICNNNEQLAGRIHEQPIVSFIKKGNDEDILYREEL